MVYRTGRQHGLSVCLLSWHSRALEEFQRSLAKSHIPIRACQLGPLKTAGSAQAGIPRAKIYVIDAHAPRPATESLVAAIQRGYPESYQLVVAEQLNEQSAFALLALGVKGLILRGEAVEQLPRALRAVAGGGFWVPRALLSSFVDSIVSSGRKRHGSGWSAQLSVRESQVLDRMLEDLSNKEIAAKLDISERTVKFHVSNILTKFGVGRRADLALLWYQQQH